MRMVDRVLVTLDGEVRDVDQPLLYADDLGTLRGDGIFETALVRGGTVRALDFHLARLRRSAQEGVMRLVLTRGRESELGGPKSAVRSGELSEAVPVPTTYVMVTGVPERVATARSEGVAVVTLTRGISIDLAQAAPWQLLGAKTLSYATNMAALRFAARMGADDVIFTSTEHRVLEGPRSTVVIVRDKQLITPPAKHGVLPGTTQRALYAEAERNGYDCRYEPLFSADLFDCDSIWMLSSVALAARVNSLDGVRLSATDSAAEIVAMVDRGIDRAGTIADW
jgi:4-amino-4-deoxychorismate lyase